MRKRVLAMWLAIAGFSPSLGHALGLGDIEVYSALNQPLLAEISLTSVRPGETDGMLVKLGSDEAFRQAGLERAFHLTKLAFVVDSKSDGTQYIKISTANPVREPFLSFLVDVDWPRGRLVREYTIFLDPPVFAESSQTAPVEVDEAAAPSTAAPVTAAGTPGLIERDETQTAIDDEFGIEPAPVQPDSVPVDIDATTPVVESAPEGFDDFADVPADAVDLSSLPDIEVDAEPEMLDTAEVVTETPVSEAEVTEDLATDTEAVPWSEEDAFGVVDSQTTDLGDVATSDMVDVEPVDVEAAELPGEEVADTTVIDDTAALDSTFTVPDSESITEDTQTGFFDSLSALLPDISIAYDPSLPYDESATNALLAQFAAEDEARALQSDLPEVEVGEGDILFNIAERYKAPDVTVNQAMIAILRYNPDAFIRDNINSVKKGFVLRIPDRDSMLQIDSNEALDEVKRQYSLWREYRSQLAGAPSTVQDAQASDDLLIAGRDTDVRDTSRGELSILSPGRDAAATDRTAGAQDGTEAGSSVYIDLQLAREQLQAAELEKKELQERLTELSDQIETQKNIITLQNEQLARLKQRLAEQPEPATESAEPAEPAEQVVDATDAIDQSNELEAAMTEAVTEMASEVADQLGATLPEQVSDLSETPSLESPPDQTTEPPAIDAPDLTDPLASASDTQAEDLAEPALDESLADETLPALPEESEVEPVLDEASDTEPEPVAEESPTVTEPTETPEIETPPARRPGGLLGYLYDLVPAPYNFMLVDLLQSKTAQYALYAVLLLLLGSLVYMLVKPKKGKAAPSGVIAAATPADTEAAKSKQAKVSFGEKLKTMFAPITGLLSKRSKPDADAAGVAAVADDLFEPADEVDAIEDDSADDATIEDVGEIDSFDASAEAAAADATVEPPEPPDFEKTTITSVEPLAQEAAPAVPAPAAEEVSDDTTQEADVYLAYGLHDQAEELLGQAIAANPDKLEYKGKLLQTYFEAKKTAEFEALAAELHTSLGGQSSRIWDKAVAMGKEIAPDNPLFSGADAGLKVEDFAPAKPETDLDLSESSGSTTPDIDFGDEDGATTTDFDLDLGEADDDDKTLLTGGSDSGAAEAEFDLGGETDAEISDLNIDFNADELGLDTDVGGEEEIDLDIGDEEQAIEDDDVTIAMDMPFDTTEAAAEAEGDSDAIELDVDDSLTGLTDVDASDLDIDDSFVGTPDGDASDIDIGDMTAGDDLLAELDLGEDGLDLSDESLVKASVETEFEIPEEDDTIIDADLDDDTIGGDESSIDEVATKLDLAKAYLDMGDHDGASSTLDEVMAEGNEGQRQEAQELMAQIG